MVLKITAVGNSAGTALSNELLARQIDAARKIMQENFVVLRKLAE